MKKYVDLVYYEQLERPLQVSMCTHLEELPFTGIAVIKATNNKEASKMVVQFNPE